METNNNDTIYLYGASGHAKVVIDILKANGVRVEHLIDDNPNINELSCTQVVHSYSGETPVIVTIGNCLIRKKIAEQLNTEFANAIHPSAIISDSASVGDGTVVMAGTIIEADARIGKHCIVNTGANINHECVVDDYVHVAPGCNISGNVHIGECSWIGVGTSIIQGISIGKNCMIGAGSVVVRDIPDNAVAYGNPCRVVKFIDN